jgi:Pregnancy-associated plasma protein-A
MAAETTMPRRLCGAMPATIRQLELNPALRGAQLTLEAATRQRRASGIVARRGLLTIPVMVHIVYQTDEQNISDGQIQSQIDVLSQDFRARNADLKKVPDVWRALAIDAQFEFRLADVTRTRTDRDAFSDDDGVKFTASGGHDVIDPARNLNIWVCNLQPWLGYAYFPGIRPEIDGVVIGYRYFGTEGTATDPFHLGRTATHEVGHYLNLYHIWGADTPTCSDTDFVDDTPNQEQPNFGKPSFPSISCSNGPHGDMYMNYMDYVDDESMFMFTAQQVVRMRTALGEARPMLGQ